MEEKALTVPMTFQEIQGMAEAFVKSGMFTDVKQMAQAVVKIQAGRELGLPPVYSMQNINMIRNRLTSSANVMAMLVKKSGKYDYRIKEHTDQKCSLTFYQIDSGKSIEVGVSTFTMDDAKRADLVKPESGWVKYPRAMLFSRAISQGARIYAPDAIGGLYTDEEIRSIPPNLQLPDETPADVPVIGKEYPEPSNKPLATPEQKKPVETPNKQASESHGPAQEALMGDIEAVTDEQIAGIRSIAKERGLDKIQLEACMVETIGHTITKASSKQEADKVIKALPNWAK